jgi:hypothetical protein
VSASACSATEEIARSLSVHPSEEGWVRMSVSIVQSAQAKVSAYEGEERRRAIRSSAKGEGRNPNCMSVRERKRKRQYGKRLLARESLPDQRSSRKDVLRRRESRIVEGKRTWFSSLRPARRPPCTSA